LADSLLAGLLLYFSLLGGSGLYGAGNAPDVGWWAYAPLASRAFSPGHSSDYWTIALLASGFGSIATAINIIATIISMRCSGMDAEPHAVAGMDELGDVWNGFASPFRLYPRLNHAARGSLSWRSFFSIRRPEAPHAVDALLLDIWAS